MGQRHQIYLRLPEIYYNENNPNNKPARTVGIHHQWLWGQTAMMLLSQYLRFLENRDHDRFTDEQLEALQCAYSFCADAGYFRHLCPRLDEDECDNPLNADNNNGITVIDLTGKKPKYCFMSLDHLECLDAKFKDKKIENLTPMNARQYIGLHYHDWNITKNDKLIYSRSSKEVCRSLSDFKKNHKILFPHAKGTQREYDTMVAETVAFRKKTRELVKHLSKYEVLTKEEVFSFFPKLKEESAKR